MKMRLLLSLILLAFSSVLFGQTLLTEDFSAGAMPPSGWSIDAHAANWKCSNSAHAGGTAKEGDFYYSPTFTAYSRLMSPVINTTGYTSLTLVFKHYVDHYDTPYTLGVATRSNSGAWLTVWSINPTDIVGPETVVTQVASSDVGSSSFQICFFFNGYSYNINDWYIDDISLEVSKNRDAATTLINVPGYSLGQGAVQGDFINMGIGAITQATVNYQVDQGAVHSDTYSSLNLPLGTSYSFSMTDLLGLTPGDYNLKVWVSNINNLGPDENAANDTLSKTIHVASGQVARRPLYEDFTSSTCAPCASFNNTYFNPWLLQYGDSVTLIKYQMSWPAPGDPYYTLEGYVRRMFYNVSYVPDLYVDAVQRPTNGSGLNDGYANSIATPAFMNIAATHYFSVMGTDTSINVHVDITSKISGVLTLFVSLVEKSTFHNTGNNGETEFHNVMMKMIPNAYGTPVALGDGATSSLDFTTSLVGTNIERWNDLMLAVWIQDTVTKEMFQGAYSDTVGVGIHEVQGLRSVKVFPNPTTGKIGIESPEKINSLSVYNSTGNLVFETANLRNNQLDLGFLPDGIYLVRMQAREGTVTRRVNILK
jgi:hypothetical protein